VGLGVGGGFVPLGDGSQHRTVLRNERRGTCGTRELLGLQLSKADVCREGNGERSQGGSMEAKTEVRGARMGQSLDPYQENVLCEGEARSNYKASRKGRTMKKGSFS